MGFIIILAIIVIWCIVQFNSLTNLKKKMEQAKSSIDVYLKQRFDLIPNLVECVKGYAKHEQETLEKIITMRNEYFASSKTLEDGAKLNNECDKLLMIAENYPDLKANEQFLNLQKSLIKIESQLQAARRLYNSEVTSYNTKISVVPSNIIAKIFGFKEADLFNIEAHEAANVNIELN